ncbi:acetyl-CoA carboxylase biotin carboxyl carrier protein [Enterococcus sp. CSURQ0835]|uniref:acetyl-CoA carboxylase biotin carboxyl carrier protein n=1 Tax=Enterococcus sp. CSURQ0835 TaxID=2681394 RepID=UPI0013568E7E|nr:acetyl-CoA carboxylase biotin carboxyl carrier protein [Enterococcus sp. CSURQ0835]
MDINEIKDLLSQFDGSTLTEFDLREGSFELYMNKNEMSRQTNQAPVSPVETTTESPASTSVKIESSNQAVSATKSEPAAATVESVGQVITSPIVGVVYLQPSPDQPEYKQIGDSVKKGETVCIIEAMKLLNEIVSDYDGVITEILVENEDVVEYGQPLFRISEE